jgi:hypothetical protein
MNMADEQGLDEMLAEFEAEWKEESEVTEETPETSEEPETPEVPETPEAETPETPEVPEEEDKRNRAFADLRREAEANKKYASFISKLAEESGVSPDEILARYEERQLAQQAEETKTPIEVLKRLNTLEQENKQSKESLRTERLDVQIQSAISKYSANDDSIRETFQYMMEAGIDPREQDNVDFEKFYRAANLDSIIQTEVEKSRQTDLENKKKRQDSASIANGTSVTQNSGDWSDEDVDDMLAKMDIKI